MSDTTIPATPIPVAPVDPPTAPSTPAPAAPPVGAIGHFLALCDRGAALIYHDVVAVSTKFEEWRSDNPALTPLFDTAVQYLQTTATAFGLPVAQGLIVVQTIGAALKQMAAADNSLKSGSSVVPASSAAS